ncbi:MAG: CoA transferase [Pseudomonadaceae bacterium]|nr:CoA transferase [Pseudomonadaceae bacterium]
MKGPLSNLVVLDLTHARAGPTAVRLLSDWGADVIKIEQPSSAGEGITGARRGPDEQNLHRNKRSITLDLKNSAGFETFLALVDRADILVENFRAPVKHSLGVDFDALHERNPRLIVASISGFGQSGPYSERAGVDQIVQGMSGLMSITGQPDDPPTRVGIAISDTSAGMFLGQGILLALLDRERSGLGQWVHTSLLEAMLNKLDFQGARVTMNGDVPSAQGNFHPTQVAMGTFPASDGFVNLAAPSQRLWERFCTALGADSLMARDDFASVGSRVRRRDEVNAVVAEVTCKFSRTELTDLLNAASVPCGPILDVGQAFSDAQVEHLGMAVPAPHDELGDLRLLRSPINLSSHPHPSEFDRAAPDPGADRDDVLASLGLSHEQITAAADKGAFG